MIKELKYIVLSIVKTTARDLMYSYNSMAKPKEVMRLLLIVFVFSVLIKQYDYAKVTIALYVIIYVWLIIRRGDWKKEMKKEKKTNST